MPLEELVTQLNSLSTELKAMKPGDEGYEEKLKEAEQTKEKIKSLQSQADRFAALQSEINSFEPPASIQPGAAKPKNVQTKNGFEDDPKVGFSCVGDFMNTVRSCQNGTKGINIQLDKRISFCADQQERFLNPRQTAGEHNTVNDGLMIPAELDPTINKIGLNASMDWFSQIPVSQTNRNALEIATSKAATRGGVVGMQAFWEGEGQQLSSTRNKYGKTLTKVNKLYVYTEATEEDLSDFAMLRTDMAVTAPELMRIKKQEAVLFGDGNKKPLGFTKGGDLATVARATANKVQAIDAAKMNARFLGNNITGFWMVNQMLLAELPFFVVGDQPVWQADFRVNSNGTLFGKAIYVTEDCEALGDLGDMNLVNPQAYKGLEKVGGRRFASSMHVLFDFDKEAFRWCERFGGRPIFEGPYVPRDNDSGNGNKDTLSNFVTLGDAP